MLRTFALVFFSLAAASAAFADDLQVQSEIVKRVTVDGLFGKAERFRYFFYVRNTGHKPFAGRIRIRLLNHQPGIVNGAGEFSGTIAPGRQAPVFVDVATGPAAFSGDWCIEGYAYEAFARDGAAVASGQGPLTDRFEDLAF